jgi:voltage-gated potassium channel
MCESNLGKTIGELKMGSIAGTAIIGLKNWDGKYVFNPGIDYPLSPKDQLFVLGLPEQVRSLNS